MLMGIREMMWNIEKFLRKILGFLNKDNTPTPEAASLPPDLETPPKYQIEKTIVLFHDESTSQACNYKCIQ